MYAWGFGQQGAGGNFPCTSLSSPSGAAAHSTSFFVSSVATSLLLMQQSGDSSYNGYISDTLPKLKAAAQWLAQDDTWSALTAYDKPYAHRRFLVGTALGLTAKLTGDTAMAQKAQGYVKEGLGLQQSDGVFPEQGGYDSSYQTASLYYAGVYYAITDDAGLRAQLATAIKKGADWSRSRYNDDGSANLAGNTRVTDGSNDENGPGGSPKTFAYRSGFESLMEAYKITGDQADYDEAKKVALYKGWITN